MDKKGVEISMNVIIVAAIGLLVLVILSLMFINKIGIFSRESTNCLTQGGKCAVACGSADDGTADYGTANPTIQCPADSAGNAQQCCLKISV
ncbi:MAG TPA: hypothetical protein VKE88_03300 [Candidatus Nanoarchaeia archaeon]|nr:hypothetical protein [Candidatus Nanoarchaeia archaeon]